MNTPSPSAQSTPSATRYVDYEPTLSLQDAVRLYFAQNGFGTDGGYHDKWVELKLGPVRFFIPNTASRVRAVRLHDLHHVLTGFRTNWAGEFEISAWELGAGCTEYSAAWWLNLSGLVAGLLSMPKRTLRAFGQGRRATSLYHEGYTPDLLTQTLDQVRKRLHITPASSPADPSMTGTDWVVLGTYTLLGIPVGLVSTAGILCTIPLALMQAPFLRSKYA